MIKFFKITIFFLLLAFCCCNDKKTESVKESTFAIINIDSVYNFGNVKRYDTVKKEIKIKNISTIPFKIDKVGVSCGCTVISISDSIIENGQSTKLLAKFSPKPNQHGNITNNLVIKGNVKDAFKIIKLKANVLE